MKSRQLVLLALIALFAMTSFGLTLPTLAYLAKDFGASDFQVGLLGACYFGMQLLFAPVWGAASDRVGRKRLLFIGLAGFGLAFGINGFATGLPALYVGKLIAGLLGSATMPAIRAGIADVTSVGNRAKGMGLVGACIGLGFVIGPGLAVGLMHAGGASGDLPLEQLIRLHQLPLRAAAILVLAAIPLLLPFLHLPVPVTAAASRHQSAPAAIASALRGPLLPVYVAALLSTFALATIEAALPLLVKLRFAGEVLPASFIGKAFIVMGITGVIVQGGLVSRIIAGMGEQRTAATGLVFAAIGYASIPLFTSPNRLLVGLVLLATGTGLIRPSIATWISRRSEGAGQGGAIGSLESFESLGRATGNPTGGALHGMQSGAPFYLAGVIALCALVPLLAGKLRAEPAPNAGAAS